MKLEIFNNRKAVNDCCITLIIILWFSTLDLTFIYQKYTRIHIKQWY